MKKSHYSIEDLQSFYGPSVPPDVNHSILVTANFGGLDNDYQYPVTIAQLSAAIGGSGGLELDPTIPVHVKNIEIGLNAGDVLTWNGAQWVSLPGLLPLGTLVGNILIWNGTTWIDTVPNFENKKNSYIFTNETLITVIHGEGEAQNIRILTPTGEDISQAGLITQTPYLNPTQFTVQFNQPVSGIIYYN